MTAHICPKRLWSPNEQEPKFITLVLVFRFCYPNTGQAVPVLTNSPSSTEITPNSVSLQCVPHAGRVFELLTTFSKYLPRLHNRNNLYITQFVTFLRLTNFYVDSTKLKYEFYPNFGYKFEIKVIKTAQMLSDAETFQKSAHARHAPIRGYIRRLITDVYSI